MPKKKKKKKMDLADLIPDRQNCWLIIELLDSIDSIQQRGLPDSSIHNKIIEFIHKNQDSATNDLTIRFQRHKVIRLFVANF